MGFSLLIVAVSEGCSLVVGLGLTVVVSLVAEQGLYGTWASVVAAHGLSSVAPGSRAQIQYLWA